MRLSSLKHKGLKLVHFGKFLKYMFCTLNFMVSFQYFPNSKWIFVQHRFCSLCQDLSNHYSHAYVWIFHMGLSKRGTFVTKLEIHMESSCTSKHHANYTSISTPNDLSLQFHPLSGLTCACTGPCMEDPMIMHTSFFSPCLAFQL